jgi:Mlc titration factor MtfA (ptsG expression regulator)
MLTALIVIPAFILALLGFWLIQDETLLAIVEVPLVMAIFLGMIFREQLNMWWYKRYPPVLDPLSKHFLKHSCAYYKQLSAPDQLKFEQRLALFRMDKQFMFKEWEELPEEAAIAVCAAAIQITFHLPKYLLSHFGNILLYRNPFVSQDRLVFHYTEMDTEDGCIVFAGTASLQGFLNPQQYFDWGTHQMALAWQYQTKTPSQQVFGSHTPEQIRHTLQQVRSTDPVFYNGLLDAELFGAAVEHFFHAPRQLQQHAPQYYQAIAQILAYPADMDTP